MYRNIIILLTTLFFVACGGGGGGAGSDETEPSNEAASPSGGISLDKVQSTEKGTVYASLLKGAWFSTELLNGAFSIENRDKIQLNGVTVTPHDMKLNLSILGGGVSSITVTSYIDDSENVLSMSIQNSDITCTSSSSINLPASVDIGDVGVISAFTCDNNKTSLASWKVDDAGDGKIDVVDTVIVKDVDGVIFSDSDVIFTLDANGNIIASRLVIRIAGGGLSLTLDSI